jgi:hypothetical protein
VIPPELLQLPVFSLAQARDRGVSRVDLQLSLRSGEITRIKRAWFTARHPEWPSERHRLRLDAELADHPGMVASHHSGAVLLGLPLHRPEWERVHLMRAAPGRGQKRADLVIHRQIPGATSLDAGLVIAQVALGSTASGLMALDAALARKLARRDDFERWLPLLHGRPGFAHLRVVAELGDGRRESPLESRTALVFHHWGWRLEPQFDVPGTPFRADSRISGTRVLIESDGQVKYADPGSEWREKIREDDIRALGWEVVRVTDQLLDEQRVLLRRVHAALDRSTRHLPLAG